MTNLSDLIASPDGSRLRREARHAEAFIRRARLTILWERVWPKLWPASGIVGVFAAAARRGGRGGPLSLSKLPEFPRADMAGGRAPRRTRFHHRAPAHHR